MASSKITGIALAGGESLRMGEDKACLSYHGLPQIRHVWALLSSVCANAYVAMRRGQAECSSYRDLPHVIDVAGVSGPAAGLLGAWAVVPGSALLVLAVDMPLVDVTLLRALLRARQPDRLATAYRHPDGTPEPLCTIWEPAARALIDARARAGKFSLREVLESSPVELLLPDAPERLITVDTPEHRERVQRQIVVSGRPRAENDD